LYLRRLERIVGPKILIYAVNSNDPTREQVRGVAIEFFKKTTHFEHVVLINLAEIPTREEAGTDFEKYYERLSD
jgi:hypothetical protein